MIVTTVQWSLQQYSGRYSRGQTNKMIDKLTRALQQTVVVVTTRGCYTRGGGRYHTGHTGRSTNSHGRFFFRTRIDIRQNAKNREAFVGLFVVASRGIRFSPSSTHPPSSHILPSCVFCFTFCFYTSSTSTFSQSNCHRYAHKKVHYRVSSRSQCCRAPKTKISYKSSIKPNVY